MSEQKEKRLRLADGPILLCEFNPKGAKHFADRVCETCSGPIMQHWLINFGTTDDRTSYWCDPDGQYRSTGMKI